jgi:hypothetical protein
MKTPDDDRLGAETSSERESETEIIKIVALLTELYYCV